MTKLVKKSKKLEASKRGKRSKNKGATYERKLANYFKEKLGITLTRTPQSGGFAKKYNKSNDFKGDIVCLEDDIDFKLHIEAKNQKSLSIRKWLNQAEGDCIEGKIPVVVYYMGEIKNKDNTVKEKKKGDYITLKLDDFMKIVDVDKIVKRGE